MTSRLAMGLAGLLFLVIAGRLGLSRVAPEVFVLAAVFLPGSLVLARWRPRVLPAFDLAALLTAGILLFRLAWRDDPDYGPSQAFALGIALLAASRRRYAAREPE